jgi:Tyrosine phosphatase family
MHHDEDSIHEREPMPKVDARAPLRRMLLVFWPWLVLALCLIPAVWHVVDFEEDVDPEFPNVVRPTFSVVPPSAYRLAEPGDTLDRIMIYMSAASVVVAGLGYFRRRGGMWPAALAVALAGLWYSATPGPTVDGWYGLGWRTITDPRAPLGVRSALLAGALVLSGVVGMTFVRSRLQLRELWDHARTRRTRGLWIAAGAFALARQLEIPGVEPEGYWPRWAMIWGMLAFNLAMVIEAASRLRSKRPLFFALPACALVWLALVVSAVAVTWYHRPLARLKVVEPGRIYISAMPTSRGLDVAYRRHRFKTIINLFPEDTPLRSRLLPDELQFVREHGIHYVGSPSDPSEAASTAFLDETLALACDPSAWPILVHCHGCMDRSPAWMGIYHFVVKGRPLGEVMREIERHRGYRPKASVILLYNRVLPARAGARYWSDPTAALLRQCAAGTLDPIMQARTNDVSKMNSSDAPRVTTKPERDFQPR